MRERKWAKILDAIVMQFGSRMRWLFKLRGNPPISSHHQYIKPPTSKPTENRNCSPNSIYQRNPFDGRGHRRWRSRETPRWRSKRQTQVCLYARFHTPETGRPDHTNWRIARRHTENSGGCGRGKKLVSTAVNLIFLELGEDLGADFGFPSVSGLWLFWRNFWWSDCSCEDLRSRVFGIGKLLLLSWNN